MGKTIKIPKAPKKKPCRCPPEHTRFKPGQSGNPKGRPKGRKNFSTLLEKELNKKVSITLDGKTVRITKKELLIKQLVNEGAKGKRGHMEMLIGLMLSQKAATQSGTTSYHNLADLSPEALGRVGERLLRKAQAITEDGQDAGGKP